jgi:transcriptional regulator with XRE-family HTH domain
VRPHGASIAAWRAERDLTAAQLADRVGYKRPTLTKIERGHMESIPLRRLLAIARALAVSPDVIMRDPVGAELHDALAAVADRRDAA